MCTRRKKLIVKSIRDYLGIFQSLVLTVVGGLTFYHYVLQAKILVPAMHSQIVLSVSLEEVGQKNSVTALRAKVKMHNRSKSKTWILASGYSVKGVNIEAIKNPSDDLAYAKEIETKIKSHKHIPRYYREGSSKFICGGSLFDEGWWLEPDEEISSDFLIYVPNKKYDLIRLGIGINCAKDKQFIHSEWKIGKDGSMEIVTHKNNKFDENKPNHEKCEILDSDNPEHKNFIKKHGIAGTMTFSEIPLWKPN
ncbi:MAG TPA: hypothetical protein DHV62_06225 [Elusimicrobia bacterium]|jgi:hypothetical protein|nr:hypothetical protein [Elusimicrobiota bacterium]